MNHRMDRHQENAAYIADFLRGHDGVTKVYYPGFEDFPGYEIQKSQAAEPGAMLSFVLSDRYDIHRFFESIRLVTLAESLGGVESLVCHPASITHASIPYNIRQKVGIVDSLFRLSVGIEDKRDLVGDLSEAFDKAIVRERS